MTGRDLFSCKTEMQQISYTSKLSGYCVFLLNKVNRQLANCLIAKKKKTERKKKTPLFRFWHASSCLCIKFAYFAKNVGRTGRNVQIKARAHECKYHRTAKIKQQSCRSPQSHWRSHVACGFTASKACRNSLSWFPLCFCLSLFTLSCPWCQTETSLYGNSLSFIHFVISLWPAAINKSSI